MKLFPLSVLTAVCFLTLGSLSVAAQPAPAATVLPSPLNEAELPANAVWVDSLDLNQIATRGRKPMAGQSVNNTPLSLAGVVYPRGVGMSGTSLLRFNLKRSATQFLADFNIDDVLDYGSVRAQLYVDGKKVSETLAKANRKGGKDRGKMHRLSADLTGASELLVALTTDGFYPYDLAGARILLASGATERPELIPLTDALAEVTGDPANVVWVDKLNALYISSGDGKPAGIKCTPGNLPLAVGGTVYGSGYAAYPNSRLPIDLKGNATRLLAQVGVNDPEATDANASVTFRVYIDKKAAFNSGAMRAGDALKTIDLDLTGASEVLLAADSDGSEANRPIAAWVGPRILVSAKVKDRKARPVAKAADQVPMPIASIVDGPLPAIHGPRVAGSSPGRPFMFTIPATGEKPLSFTATGLPPGLTLDSATGFITGKLDGPLTAQATLTVRNALGQASRPLTIICAPYGMVPTPPMGWNHWHQWAMSITEARVREAADALVEKGFAAHGYIYVNIDEGWQGVRAADGTISGAPQQGFNDMKALGDYIHSKGLKFGLYSTPGPLCCGKRLGSMGHEQQDANTWASWGVDYLKYDGCSGNSLRDLRQRWKLMRECLDNTGRDIVYSTNSTRDPEAGAQLWRTTSDIRNNWLSLTEMGFIKQTGLEKLAGPGRYNDPDMLIVGNPADLNKGSGITRNEQITHVTLWSMLAAPMLLGCDLTKADDFLFSLMCNDDVLAVNQDPLVRQGSCLRKDPPQGSSDMGAEVWTRPLFDGTTAVAFFNRGSEPALVRISWKELGLAGPQAVRDCWMRKDLGELTDGYEVKVETHAAVLIKVGQPKTDRFTP